MTLLQAAAAVILWRSRRFDTHDIALALGGGYRRRMSAASFMPFAKPSADRTYEW